MSRIAPVSPVCTVLALLAWAGPSSVALAGPELASAPEHAHDFEPEPTDPAYYESPMEPLAAIDCAESTDTGYVQGDPFTITVVHVDGKPVEVETANAFYAMQQAAAADGVGITVVSGFRTMEQQEYLYGCYIDCDCNNCNLAAKPGYSNHQSGHALDLNTGAAGVYNWLAAHGDEFGFEETVPSEDWHWEWWGGGPATDGPCGKPAYRAEFVEQSFPFASKPPVILNVGECLDAWIDLKNTGEAGWNGDTRLAPTPRDVASPLHDAATWMSPTRIAAPDVDTAPGEVGHFSFRFCGTQAGDFSQTFGLVQEGVTWFSDKPKGGGPPDNQLEVHIVVIDAAPPPPPPPPLPDATTSAGGEEGGSAEGGEGGSGEGGESDGPGEGGASDSVTGGASDGAPGPDSGSATGGSADDDAGCGCRGDGSPAGWLLAPLLLALRRRRAR